MSSYHDGRRVEYAVLDDLNTHGYATIRGASSKGLADVVAVKPGQVLIVNVKRTRPPGPADRVQLLKVASCLPGVAVPLIATKPLRQPLAYRRVTGPGPKDWQPWTPDSIGDEA